jgi:hypothetical protein
MFSSVVLLLFLPTSSVTFVFFVSGIIYFFLSLFPYLSNPSWTHRSVAQGIKKLLITIFTVYTSYTRAAACFNHYVVIVRPLKYIHTKITNAKLVPWCGAESSVFRVTNAETED